MPCVTATLSSTVAIGDGSSGPAYVVLTFETLWLVHVHADRSRERQMVDHQARHLALTANSCDHTPVAAVLATATSDVHVVLSLVWLPCDFHLCFGCRSTTVVSSASSRSSPSLHALPHGPSCSGSAVSSCSETSSSDDESSSSELSETPSEITAGRSLSRCVYEPQGSEEHKCNQIPSTAASKPLLQVLCAASLALVN